MKTSITETTNKLLFLKEKISDLELQIRTVNDEIKEEISKIGDIVEELAVYIKLNNYPIEIYLEESKISPVSMFSTSFLRNFFKSLD